MTGRDIPAAAAVLSRLLDVGGRADSRVAVIAESLARDIIEGRLVPGADLNSVELARRFHSSRTPVREALMLLDKEGLVTIPPRRRPRVAVLDPHRVAEVYRLRAELYAIVSRRVAELAAPEQLTALRDIVAAMDRAARARDVDTYFWQNVSFHEYASDVAADSTLKRMLDSLGVQVLRLRHHTLSLPDRMHLSLQDHWRLVRAYDERDIDLAGALARSIVASALNAMLAEPRISSLPKVVDNGGDPA